MDVLKVVQQIKHLHQFTRKDEPEIKQDLMDIIMEVLIQTIQFHYYL